MKFLNYAGLEHLVEGIKEKFVQKVSGKDLSTNDFTNVHKEKLEGVENNSQENKIELIKKNGINVPIDGSKAVDLDIPTKLSELKNDKSFQSKAEILSLIKNESVIKKEIVGSLPSVASADEGKFYLIRNEQDTGYEEWMVVDGEWEILGDTAAVDFTGYVSESDITFISNEEIDEIMRV